MNNFSGVNARTRRNLLRNDLSPIEITIANYSTDARKKTEMKHQYCESLLLNNLHLIPDPLKKNLADSVVTGEVKLKSMETKNYVAEEEAEKPPSDQKNDFYPKLAGFTNFISSVFNTMGAIFLRRASSPVSQYYDCFESDFDGAMDKSVPWQPAKFEDQNINGWAHSMCDKDDECTSDLNTDMLADCKTAITSCEDKINKVRLLLNNHANLNQVQCKKYCRRPKRAFFEPGSVEDSFEDAFTPEDFADLPSEPYLEQHTQFSYHNNELTETCPMKIKTNIHVKEEMDVVSSISEDNINNISPKKNVISSCEDKMNKIKELLQSKCKKNTSEKADSNVTDVPAVLENLSNDTVFGSELNMDVHNSSTQTVNSSSDCFDEVLGKFYSSSVESDDSFQIVFADTPQNCRRRTQSDCESEDSFIVFEETPDSCYVSHDVFGDEVHENESSESELSDIEDDSGCMNTKLAHNLSRTFEDLTDDKLYEQNGQDVVDFAVSVSDGVPGDKNGQLGTEPHKAGRSQPPVKKVQFSTDPPKVHVMRVWAFAAKQARMGHWERLALDRERFKRRIANAEVALSWVLKPQHRTRIVFQRFRPWWNAQKRKELAEKNDDEDRQKQILQKAGGINEETETGDDDCASSGTVIVADNDLKSNISLNKMAQVLKEHQTQVDEPQSYKIENNHINNNDFNCVDNVFESIDRQDNKFKIPNGVINFTDTNKHLCEVNYLGNNNINSMGNRNDIESTIKRDNPMLEVNSKGYLNTDVTAGYSKTNGDVLGVCECTIKGLNIGNTVVKTDINSHKTINNSDFTTNHNSVLIEEENPFHSKVKEDNSVINDSNTNDSNVSDLGNRYASIMPNTAIMCKKKDIHTIFDT